MSEHSHRFVEEYNGFVGFGLGRETDESTLIYYLQKFSDDEFAKMLVGRMSGSDMEVLFDTITGLMKKYISDDEYHRFFLKE